MLNLHPPLSSIIAKMRKKTAGLKRPYKVPRLLLTNSPSHSATVALSGIMPLPPPSTPTSPSPTSSRAPVLVVALPLAVLPTPLALAVLGWEARVEDLAGAVSIGGGD